jgi:hypothetical protein
MFPSKEVPTAMNVITTTKLITLNIFAGKLEQFSDLRSIDVYYLRKVLRKLVYVCCKTAARAYYKEVL